MTLTVGQSLWTILFSNGENYQLNVEIDQHESAFIDFLKSTTIKRKRGWVDIVEVQDASAFEAADTTSFIISLIRKFVQADQGLEKPYFSVHHHETAYPNLDFLIDCVRGAFWLRFCSMVGRKSFVHILNTAESFISRSLLVYWMFLQNETPLKSTSGSYLSKAGMMYANMSRRNNFQLLEESDLHILTYVEYPDAVNSRNIPKRARKFMGLLRRARIKDAQINYAMFYKALIRESQGLLGTPVECVVNFVSSVLDKLFSSSLIGCSRNRRKLREFLSKFLKCPKKTRLLILSLTKSLKMNTIQWLGRLQGSSCFGFNDRRQNLVTGFMKYIFIRLIPRLIRHFWYVTETSTLMTKGTTFVSFIPHKDWLRMSECWLKDYARDYLVKDHLIIQQPRYKHGVMRLVPKKSDFRPLCIPLRYQHLSRDQRLSQEEVRSSYFFEKNVLGPVRDAIRSQQLNKALFHFKGHLKCFSTNDVTKAINVFKRKLFTHNGLEKVTLHAIKFDMKHCYDNLHQAKIIQSVRNLFSGEEEATLILKKSFEYSGRNINFPRLNKLAVKSDQLESLWPSNTRRKSIAVKAFQKSMVNLSRLQIFELVDVVLDQIANGIVQVKNDLAKYTRKRGVFQGTALLATFCDVLYDQLVYDSFAKTNLLEESLLIRLADDFLIISPQLQVCQTVYEKASSEGFRQYGAYVNRQKSQLVSSANEATTMKFVGLDIIFPSLDIKKTILLNMVPPSKSLRSFSHFLSYLICVLELKLRDQLFDSSLMEVSIFEHNVRHIVVNVLRCVDRYAAKIEIPTFYLVDLEVFERRSIFLISEVAQKCHIPQEKVDLLCKLISKSIYKTTRPVKQMEN